MKHTIKTIEQLRQRLLDGIDCGTLLTEEEANEKAILADDAEVLRQTIRILRQNQ